ncbi:MAG: phage integrase N-terminal SAM-like domain-containing protein, partial [Streptosporangiaceae bacterium]|nr:phage integrase N-terminal SAM-like domain-containing protein [Streptosporangiaceae bacterium]
MADTVTPAGVGELSVLLASWRLHLEAANLSPRTIRAYTDDGALFAAFLARHGMPTAVASIRREHVETFIAGELDRTAPSSAATRFRSLQQFFRWLDDEGEIDASPMAKMRRPIIPEQPVPVLSDDEVRRLLDGCTGRDFRNRRDAAIIRLFLDTGMRLEGMAGLRYSADDPDASDVDLRAHVVRVT